MITEAEFREDAVKLRPYVHAHKLYTQTGNACMKFTGAQNSFDIMLYVCLQNAI